MPKGQPESKTGGRAHGRREAVIVELRQRILSGKLPPGSPLPKRTELIRELGTSSGTLQVAMDKLIRDGFLYARRGLGTFVTKELPHMFRYALIIPASEARDGKNFSMFWVAIKAVAKMIEKEQNRQLPVFEGVGFEPETEEHRRLMEDVEAYRVAGLIFTAPPMLFSGTPLFTTPGIARVSIQSHAPRPDIPAVYPETPLILRRGLEHLLSRGRRRVALIGTPHTREDMEPFERFAAEQGGVGAVMLEVPC